MRHDRITNAAIIAAAVFLLSAGPASADGLAGVLLPAVGIPVTLGIAALEAVILKRLVGGPHPWRESLIANLISAAAGWVFVVWMNLSQPNPVMAWPESVFLTVLFAMTLVIEFSYLYLRWRRFGAKRVALGVLLANAASYALLIPVVYVSDKIWP